MIALLPLLITAALGTRHWVLERPSNAGGVPCECLVLNAQSLQTVPVQEVIAEIRVHGNLLVSNEDVMTIAGVAVGDPFGSTTIGDVTARLRASKKFHDIDVLKRFASISDPSRIVLVIVVNEGPVRIDVPKSPSAPVRVVKRGGVRNVLFMPIVEAEDGYGLTYGARLALVGTVGPRSRLSFPLTWGGMKHAGAELERPLVGRVISRVLFGAAIERQKNPAYQENDDRERVWARAERAAGPLRVGGTLGWQQVTFEHAVDHIRSTSGDVTFDTRLDPVLPRNAVYAVASWEHLDFESGGATNRTRVEGRGYVGLIGPSVFAVTAVREDADRPLPLYLKSLLGGWSNLRGFEAGSFTGDTLVSGSAEIRVPLSSPLKIAHVGVSAFVDAGAAYDKGQHYDADVLHRSVGGSVWLVATVFHIGLSVAHGQGASTRVNFGGGFTF